MTTFQFFFSFLAGGLIVVAYRQLLLPGLWRNVAVLYPVFGIGGFLAWGDTGNPWDLLLSAAGSFPIFVGAVFLGAWAEKKLAAHKSEP